MFILHSLLLQNIEKPMYPCTRQSHSDHHHHRHFHRICQNASFLVAIAYTADFLLRPPISGLIVYFIDVQFF